MDGRREPHPAAERPGHPMVASLVLVVAVSVLVLALALTGV